MDDKLNLTAHGRDQFELEPLEPKSFVLLLFYVLKLRQCLTHSLCCPTSPSKNKSIFYMKRRLPVMDLPARSRLDDGIVALVERNHEPCGVKLVNDRAVARRAPSDLVELAREIQTADGFIKATACGKLQVIAEQVRFLQSQARKVLEEAKLNSNLHHAACNFRKLPGQLYHLYQRQSGQTYFSMLSPQEWGGEGKCPHQFLGTFRLEHDMSWTPEEKLQERTDEMTILDKVISSGQNVAISYSLSNT